MKKTKKKNKKYGNQAKSKKKFSSNKKEIKKTRSSKKTSEPVVVKKKVGRPRKTAMLSKTKPGRKPRKTPQSRISTISSSSSSSSQPTTITAAPQNKDVMTSLSVQAEAKKPVIKRRRRGLAANTTQAENLNTFDLFDSLSDIEPTTSFRETGPAKIKNKIVRKKPGAKSINYFDNYTQLAIVSYQAEQEVVNKNKIYLEKIFPAFDALVENLINVYGFTVAYESRNDLKNECLEFLYTALPKFNAEKGSKAFSYFNVVAKHWLTIKSKQNAKKTQSYISIDNKDAIGIHDMETIEGYSVVPGGEELMIDLENKELVKELLKEVTDKAKTDNEKTCVKAINVLMSSIDDIDLLNKRAILLYLREITGLSSKQLSVVLANLKKYYKDVKRKEEYC